MASPKSSPYGTPSPAASTDQGSPSQKRPLERASISTEGGEKRRARPRADISWYVIVQVNGADVQRFKYSRKEKVLQDPSKPDPAKLIQCEVRTDDPSMKWIKALAIFPRTRSTVSEERNFSLTVCAYADATGSALFSTKAEQFTAAVFKHIHLILEHRGHRYSAIRMQRGQYNKLEDLLPDEASSCRFAFPNPNCKIYATATLEIDLKGPV